MCAHAQFAEVTTNIRDENNLDRGVRVTLGAISPGRVFRGSQTPWGRSGRVSLVPGLVGGRQLDRLPGISSCPLRR